MNRVWGLLLALYIFLLPINFIVYVLLFSYKQVVCKIAKCFCGCVAPIPSSNCVFIADKIHSKPHSTVVCILDLEKKLSKRNAVKNGWEYAYKIKDGRGERCYKELGYTPVYILGYGFWKQIPNFYVADYVHVLQNCCESDPERQQSFLLSIVESLQRKPFSKGKPLWEAYLLYKYEGQRKRTLMIIRYHHIMADGISFVKFFYAAAKRSDLPSQFTKPHVSLENWRTLSSINIFQKVKSFFSLLTVGFVDYLYGMLIEKDNNALQFEENGNVKFTNDWICGMSRQIDVALLKEACKTYNCSITHLLLAAISKGIENYMMVYSVVPKKFHYFSALPIPGHYRNQFVNHWCLAKVVVKTGFQDARTRVDYFKEECLRCAATSMPMVSAAVFKVACSVFPVPLADMMTKAKGTISANISNLVGPQKKERLFSRALVSDLMFWLPNVQRSSALGIGAMSCNGKIRFCLTADSGCIMNRYRLQRLGEMIVQEMNALCSK